MKKYEKNPRTISNKQYKELKNSLKELGDLSGIILDLNTDQIIGGNQRSDIFDINNCKIEYINKYDKPTKSGTVAEGHILWEDQKFNYREVKWTDDQCKKACIIANSGGGDWDFKILDEFFDASDLVEWGVVDEESPEEIIDTYTIPQQIVPQYPTMNNNTPQQTAINTQMQNYTENQIPAPVKYTPVYEPIQGQKLVNENQFNKAPDVQQMVQKEKEKIETIVCPHCGEELNFVV